MFPMAPWQMAQVVPFAGAVTAVCRRRCSKQKDLGEDGRDGVMGGGQRTTQEPQALSLALAGCWELSLRDPPWLGCC